jgi:hypothetical protein
MNDLAALLDPVLEPMLHDPPDIALVRSRAQHRRRARRVASAAVVGGLAIVLVAAGTLILRRDSSSTVRIEPAHTHQSPTTATTPVIDPNAATTPTDQRVHVVDSQGVVQGWVIHDTLYGADLSEPVTVAVYDDAGSVVGYYNNFAGFLESSEALTPDFDAVQFVLHRLTEAGQQVPSSVSSMTAADYATCQRETETNPNFWSSPSACATLFRLVGGPVAPTTSP